MSHTLIVLPDDSAQPIVDALAAAKSSLRIRTFVSSDPTLRDAVIAARRRGVAVHVLLDPVKHKDKPDVEAARRTLQEAGVTVAEGDPAFAHTDQRAMIIDDAIGLVESLDWESRKLAAARDYALLTRYRDDVDQMLAAFDAEWHRRKWTPAQESRLIWCPDNGRIRLARFIDDAKHTLFVQNEHYEDAVIIEHLVRAARRGVKVHVLARLPRKLGLDTLDAAVGGLRIMDDVGVKVHTMKGLKLRAKTLLADGKRAIVGAINFVPGSFDARRELAVETDEPAVVKRLAATAQHDWDDSHRLDLGDAALRAFIERHAARAAEKRQPKS